jgi:uncharacterized phage-associated protein
MPITALQLGSELVRRSAARGQPLTNLSAQKLAYFAHGWHLALLGEPLIMENFEAWRYGPVLPELYHVFKVFSGNPIPPDHPLIEQQPRLDDASMSAQLIERVLDVYSGYGSSGLVSISHDPSGPWYPAYHSPSVSSIIPHHAIQTYFEDQRKH